MPHAGMPSGIERYFKDIKVCSCAANNLSVQRNQKLYLLFTHVSAWFVNTSGMTLVDKKFISVIYKDCIK
jgi:hypothetical protein